MKMYMLVVAFIVMFNCIESLLFVWFCSLFLAPPGGSGDMKRRGVIHVHNLRTGALAEEGEETTDGATHNGPLTDFVQASGQPTKHTSSSSVAPSRHRKQSTDLKLPLAALSHKGILCQLLSFQWKKKSSWAVNIFIISTNPVAFCSLYCLSSNKQNSTFSAALWAKLPHRVLLLILQLTHKARSVRELERQ